MQDCTLHECVVNNQGVSTKVICGQGSAAYAMELGGFGIAKSNSFDYDFHLGL